MATIDSDANAPTITSLQNVKEFGQILSCKALAISMELKKFLSEIAQRKENDQVFNELLFAALAFRKKRTHGWVLNKSIDHVLCDTTGKRPIKPVSDTEQYYVSPAAVHAPPTEDEYKKRRDDWSSCSYKEAFNVVMDPHFTLRGVLHVFSILKFFYELGEIYPLIHMLGYPKTFLCFSIMKEFNTIPLWCAYAVGDIVENEDFKLLTLRISHAAEQLLDDIKWKFQEQDERPPTVCDVELFSNRLHGIMAIEPMDLAFKSLQSDCNESTERHAMLAQFRIIQILGEYPYVLRIPNFCSNNSQLWKLFRSLQDARSRLSHLCSREIQHVCSSTPHDDPVDFSTLLLHVKETWNLWKELDWKTYKNEIETCERASTGNKNSTNVGATTTKDPRISDAFLSITSKLQHINEIIDIVCSSNQCDTKEDLRIQCSYLRKLIPDSRKSAVHMLALQYTLGCIGESLNTLLYQPDSSEWRSHSTNFEICAQFTFPCHIFRATSAIISF